MSDKDRIILLEKSLFIARSALGQIKDGAIQPKVVAQDALNHMKKLEVAGK